MKYLLLVFIPFLLFSCHQEENIPVEIDAKILTKEDLTSPVFVTIENNTKNAEEFMWTFENGDPSFSNKKNPGTVIFALPGNHCITLEAWNLGSRESKSYIVHVDSVVTLNFKFEAIINNYSPAQFVVTNLSKGPNFYKWTFEGAEPSVYEGVSPPVITYSNEGIYSILLVANNGSASFSLKQDVEVGKSLDGSFEILPSFEDADDMEAPLRATFETKLQGEESIKWECEGAEITNPTSKDAKILFPEANIYTVYLEISNGKTVKRISRSIEVKENTNLRSFNDIKLGISTSQETIGSFFSTKLRQIARASDVSHVDGKMIDIAYLGFDNSFSYNRFVSPDILETTVLNEIPNAMATKFINKQELGNLSLSIQDFYSMKTDALLKKLDIKTANYGDESFDKSLPRVVLFETSDGRRGAINVKDFVSFGKEGSYILVDIKVQKND